MCAKSWCADVETNLYISERINTVAVLAEQIAILRAFQMCNPVKNNFFLGGVIPIYGFFFNSR